VGRFVSLRPAIQSIGDIGSGATREEIDRAAGVLGFRFPADFVDFLADIGWVDNRVGCFLGLGADVHSALDVVRVCLSERREAFPPPPDRLLPLLNDGSGNYYCLNVPDSAERPSAEVVFWEHEGSADQVPEVISPNFEKWFVRKVQGLGNT
jgi:hypothetical protein